MSNSPVFLVDLERGIILCVSIKFLKAVTSFIPRWPGRGTEEELRPLRFITAHLRFFSAPVPGSSAALTSSFSRTDRLTFSPVRFFIVTPLNRDLLIKNGSDDLVSVLQVLREEADEDTDG